MGKVLQIISSSGLYGAERVLLELSLFLREQGWGCEVGVFAPTGQPTPEVALEARRQGLPLVLFPSQGPLDSLAVLRLGEYVARAGIDLVHSHGYKSDVYSALARFPCGVQRVATCHNWLTESFKLLCYELLDKLVLLHFDRVVAVSPDIEQQLLAAGIPPERCRRIDNGVGELPPPAVEAAARRRARLGLAPQERLLIRVGRLGPEKANDLLLRAVARLGARASLRLLFVGDGEQRQLLEQQAQALGLGERVIFAGFCPDVAELLAASDLFVISSLYEGLPMVLLEAMAARVPVVSTAVGAIPQVVQHGEQGLLVQPGDDVGLAAAVLWLLENPADGQRLAENAYQRFQQRYSRTAMGNGYLELYAPLLSARPTAGALSPTTAPGQEATPDAG